MLWIIFGPLIAVLLACYITFVLAKRRLIQSLKKLRDLCHEQANHWSNVWCDATDKAVWEDADRRQKENIAQSRWCTAELRRIGPAFWPFYRVGKGNPFSN